MTLITVQYKFEQRFPFDADRAFAWCVDFQPEDMQYMTAKARRQVRRLSDDAIVLKDTRFREGLPPVVKTRLVRIRPSERSWTNTHLAGPNRHSQFWYHIVPDGKNASHLEYTGLHVERIPGKATVQVRRALERELAKGDSATWKRLVKGMAKDLGK